MKEKLIEWIRDCDKECDVVIKCKEECKHSGKGYPLCFHDKIADRLIANGVTVREQGEWVHDPLSSYGVHVWFCSQCNGEVIRQTDYCPNCGADMRGAT